MRGRRIPSDWTARDFKEVYELLRANLAGAPDGNLNRAVVEKSSSMARIFSRDIRAKAFPNCGRLRKLSAPHLFETTG